MKEKTKELLDKKTVEFATYKEFVEKNFEGVRTKETLTSKQTLNLEKQLFDAADKLRGQMDNSEYKDIVLGLLLLKHFTDKFEHATKLIEKEIDNVTKKETLKVHYKAVNTFYIPEKANWNYLIQFSNTPEIVKLVIDAFKEIEAENEQLKNATMHQAFATQNVKPKVVESLMNQFKDLVTDFSITGDVIGQIYEYFMDQFAKGSGKSGGEFYTPGTMVDLLVELIEPYDGIVYDPCCGSGGMFVHTIDHMRHNGKNVNKVMFYGQEKKTSTWKLAKMNLAIRNIPNSDIGERAEDTFTTFLNKKELVGKANYVLANPPFNLKEWSIPDPKDIRLTKYGKPAKGNANYAWLTHILTTLGDDGIGAVILSQGAVSTNQKDEMAIRQKMIEQNKVKAIITMPTSMFYGTGIGVNIWVIGNKKTNADVLFIDATKLGQFDIKTLRVMKDHDRQLITNLFSAHLSNVKINIPGFAKNVSTKEIEEKGFTLNPSQFIDSDEIKLTKEQIDEKIKLLKTEVLELSKRKTTVEAEIKNWFDKYIK